MKNSIPNVYSYKSPKSECVNCGDAIIKLDEHHDDSWWVHERSKVSRCPSGKNGVKLELFAHPSAIQRIGGFFIGAKVYWQGQVGECSGIISAITRPENSSYVLRVDSGDGVETFHGILEVFINERGWGARR